MQSVRFRRRENAYRTYGLALGVTLALGGITALRTPGRASIGELLLVVWIAALWVTFPAVRHPASLISKVLASVVAIGAIAGFGLSVLGLATSDWPSWTLVTLTGSLLLVYSIEVHRPRLLLPYIIFAFGALSVILAALLYVTPAGIVSSLGLAPAVPGARFRGTTNNPNQQAGLMLLAIASLLVVQLRGWRSAFRYALVAAAVAVALLTDSDSARFGLLAGLGAVLVVGMPRRFGRSGPIVVLLWLAAVSWTLRPEIQRQWERIVREPLAAEGAQLGARQDIWGACVRTAISRPLGTGNNIVAVDGVATRYACHNLYLDAAVIGGLPSVLLLLWALWSLTRLTWKRGDSPVLASLVALLVFSFGNSLVRFPTFWVVLLGLYWLLRSDRAQHVSPNERRVDPRASLFQTNLSSSRLIRIDPSY